MDFRTFKQGLPEELRAPAERLVGIQVKLTRGTPSPDVWETMKAQAEAVLKDIGQAHYGWLTQALALLAKEEARRAPAPLSLDAAERSRIEYLHIGMLTAIDTELPRLGGSGMAEWREPDLRMEEPPRFVSRYAHGLRLETFQIRPEGDIEHQLLWGDTQIKPTMVSRDSVRPPLPDTWRDAVTRIVQEADAEARTQAPAIDPFPSDAGAPKDTDDTGPAKVRVRQGGREWTATLEEGDFVLVRLTGREKAALQIRQDTSGCTSLADAVKYLKLDQPIPLSYAAKLHRLTQALEEADLARTEANAGIAARLQEFLD